MNYAKYTLYLSISAILLLHILSFDNNLNAFQLSFISDNAHQEKEADRYYDLFWDYYKDSIDLSLHYAQLSANTAGKIGDKPRLAKAYFAIGWIFQTKNNIENSVRFYLEALKLYQDIDDLSGQSSITRNLAKIAKDNHEYKIAAELYEQRVSICRKLGDYRKIAESIYESGLPYEGLNAPDSAVARYLEGLSILMNEKNQKDTAFISIIHKQIGLNLIEEQKFNETTDFNLARDHFHQALFYDGSTQSVCKNVNSLGYMLMLEGNYHEALELYDSALRLKNEIGSSRLMLTTLNNIGIAYYHLDQLDSASRYFSKAISENIDPGYLETREDYNLRINWETDTELMRSHQYLDSISMKIQIDQLLSESMTKIYGKIRKLSYDQQRINELYGSYKIETQVRLFQEQEKREQLERDNRLILIIGAIVIATLIITLVVMYFYYKKTFKEVKQLGKAFTDKYGIKL